ncbi:acyl carrier protein [Streptosporangium amethystogenes subsp. fukuiense]|uniref:Acyl carrier protein n=1 Tax=Streptosporangium amethystogenes subsp. fukuiense TaxID=698418 RepID=A0ABW2SZ09_9ACTN
MNTESEEMLQPTLDSVHRRIRGFLEERIKTDVAVDKDLFASGLVNSMFAMELVVYLEQAYGIAIVGEDLKLDNFRTVEQMTSLVLRLLDTPVADRG